MLVLHFQFYVSKVCDFQTAAILVHNEVKVGLLGEAGAAGG
jgi:hypothetical protein